MKKNFKCIDDALGEKSKRFFSSGYKRTTRVIKDIVVTPDAIDSTCSVSMPKDWSIKGSSVQLVHLSSVDAVLIALQLSEAFCTVLYNLSGAMRRAISIISFSSKAGRQSLKDLKNFRATASLSSRNGDSISFSSYVGGIEVELQLKIPFKCNPPARISRKGVCYSFISDILGKFNSNFYGLGFTRAQHEIKNILVNLDASSVTATLDNSYPSRAAYQGMETVVGFNYCASPIDAMVITSQLAQCYLYFLDGLSRENSSTLWMRAMRFSIVSMTNSDETFVGIDIVRSEKVLLDGVPWRCINAEGYIGNMVIFYGLGHALPH